MKHKTRSKSKNKTNNSVLYHFFSSHNHIHIPSRKSPHKTSYNYYIRVLRDAEAETDLQKAENKKLFETFSKVFRLNGDELSFLPIKINFTTLSPEQKTELQDLLTATLKKLAEQI